MQTQAEHAEEAARLAAVKQNLLEAFVPKAEGERHDATTAT